MPIYAYKCQGCGHKFDKIQRLSDAPLIDCPQCHEPALKKQVTAAAFKLTGTGWYETDFKNNNSNKSQKSDDSKAQTASDSKKTDSDSGSKDTKNEAQAKSKKDAA